MDILKFFGREKSNGYDPIDPASELFLPSATKEDDTRGNPLEVGQQKRRRWTCASYNLTPWILSVVLLIALVFVSISPTNRHCNKTSSDVLHSENATYSPAQHLIETQNVVFTSGFDDGQSKYQGPSEPERDKAWEDLYNFGVSRIPKSSAAKLVNKTVPLPGDPGYYVVSLNVFHQLHCVNMIRKNLWSKKKIEASDGRNGIEHLSHCVDALRQSLMCSVDITPIPWVLDPAAGGPDLAVAEAQHTCRNFEKVRNWAKENRVKEFNRKIHVEDDLA